MVNNMNTITIQPKRRGMPPYIVGRPVIRLANYARNATMYFYSEAVEFMHLLRGDGIRILKTGGTFYLHHLPKDSENMQRYHYTAYKVGGRNVYSLTVQLSGQANALPEGQFTIDQMCKHPEFNIMVFPLKFDHR